jgi:hypothetical protein
LTIRKYLTRANARLEAGAVVSDSLLGTPLGGPWPLPRSHRGKERRAGPALYENGTISDVTRRRLQLALGLEATGLGDGHR